ncbi:MAG: hypothetical protein DRJ42_01065 [Deltaproteobacteria bacterium]|nr:MAG: hypothetical protein DRJ42_01065 [Deltaproteobacteria bacterium]
MLILVVVGCDCSQSHERDASLDVGVDALADTAPDARPCPAMVYHRPCGAPADRCAIPCACRSDFVLEMCDVDELGSCIGRLTFCEALELRGFQSVALLECGLTPDGVATCNWQLDFRDGRYRYGHSDVSESGTYRCDGDTVMTDSFTGVWDDEGSVLVWDGVAFEMTPQACPD